MYFSSFSSAVNLISVRNSDRSKTLGKLALESKGLFALDVKSDHVVSLPGFFMVRNDVMFPLEQLSLQSISKSQASIYELALLQTFEGKEFSLTLRR